MPKQCHDPTDDFMMSTVTVHLFLHLPQIFTRPLAFSLMVLLKDISSLKFPIDNYILHIPIVTTVSTPSIPPYNY